MSRSTPGGSVSPEVRDLSASIVGLATSITAVTDEELIEELARRNRDMDRRMRPVSHHPSRQLHYTPVQLFDYIQFEQFAELTPRQWRNYLDAVQHLAMSTTNYFWGNTHYRFSDLFGCEYSFQVSVSDKPFHGARPDFVFTPSAEVSVWCVGGINHSASIGRWPLTLGNGKNEVWHRSQTLREIVKTAERYGKGEYACTKCGAWSSERPAGSFYAGRYCVACWEGGVRQQEANEKYD